MKGIVFTEFLEMVEQKFGLGMVDTIIENAELESQGAYTAVGTYKFSELVDLIVNLSKETNIEVDDLIHVYARYFFNTLVDNHSDIFKHYKTAFDMLAGIEKHIHVHVRKIYPDAELPYFDVKEESDTKLVLEYHSERGLHSFAQGLMERTLEHYQEKATITKEPVKEDGTVVMFTLVKE